MKISQLISTLQDVLAENGDINIYIPTYSVYWGGVTEEDDIDICVLDGSSTVPDYSQPEDHPEGLYLYIAGKM